MAEFKTGQMVEIHAPAHPYSHMGFVDPSYIVPEKTEQYRVARVTRGGDRLALRRHDNTGCAIIVSEWLARGNSIRVIA